MTGAESGAGSAGEPPVLDPGRGAGRPFALRFGGVGRRSRKAPGAGGRTSRTLERPDRALCHIDPPFPRIFAARPARFVRSEAIASRS